MPTALVTGAGGLVGAEAVRHFVEAGYDVVGVENDMRARYFGPSASTRAVTDQLTLTHPEFHHVEADTRLGGERSEDRLRRQRARDAAPARSGAASRP
jgi:CDP-paratose 2-epimerase